MASLQQAVQLLHEPLEVGHVARSSEHRVRAERLQTLDVTESSERSVRR